MAASSLVRPPPASLIVRSLSKPRYLLMIPGKQACGQCSRKRRFAGIFCPLGVADLLLAMQKVVGSNPISRSQKGLHLQALFVGAVGLCVCIIRQ
jgi:hypothetical protein